MSSCVSTLRRIQSDVGISDKELKRAVHNIATPREVTLEEISYSHTKEERKEEKKRQKYMKKVSKKKKLKWAYWYLEKYLRKEFAYKLFYSKYHKLKELVNAAYEAFLGLVQWLTCSDGPVSKEEMLEILSENEPKEYDEYEIPDSQWEAYGKYLKKHPLKDAEDIWTKRKKFLKSLRKTKRKYYSKKRLAMYDPVYAVSHVEEKEMIENLERISAQNALRIAEFHKFLDSLFKNNGISANVMKKFDKQTDQIMEHHRRRIKEFKKRSKERPTPVSIDIDDEPRVYYDDWDDPDSLDSVLKIRIGDL